VLAPCFTSITVLRDGNPALSLAAVSNVTYRIDAATDWVNWTALTNIAAPSGALHFIDLGATNFSQRLYRAVWVP